MSRRKRWRRERREGGDRGRGRGKQNRHRGERGGGEKARLRENPGGTKRR